MIWHQILQGSAGLNPIWTFFILKESFLADMFWDSAAAEKLGHGDGLPLASCISGNEGPA